MSSSESKARGNPLLREDMDYTLPDMDPLLPAQNEGVHFLLSKFNGILAFQTGLGKTYTSLVASQHILNRYDDVVVVIVCPKEANTVFKKELSTKLGKPYSVYSVDDYQEDEGSRYHIFNHSSIRKYHDILLKVIEGKRAVLIVDEGHTLQNPQTKFTRYMQGIRDKFSCIWLLTATPLLNHMDGLYHIVNFVRKGYFGNFASFKRRFLVTRKRTVYRGNRRVEFDEVMGYRNLDKLKQLVDEISIVRNVVYNLNFYYLKTVMSEEEYPLYEMAAKGIMGEDYDELNEKDFGPRLHDLQRVVDNSYSFREGSIEVVSNKISNKEKLLFRKLKEIMELGESALVYTDYSDTLERLYYLLDGLQDRIGYTNLYKITGSVNFAERRQVQDKIGNSDIVLMTKAGKQSLNLGRANHFIFYNIPFSIGYFLQSLGRITRVDTEYQNQNVYLLEVEGTIDTYKRMLVQDHAELIKNVFGDNSNLPKDTRSIDRKYINLLRRELLWKFK